MSGAEVIGALLEYIGKHPDPDEELAKALRMILMLWAKGEKPEPKTESKKAEPKKKRKEFDMGKLKALREGGWSVPKIADEMKVSEQTIYNKLKQLEEQGNE